MNHVKHQDTRQTSNTRTQSKFVNNDQVLQSGIIGRCIFPHISKLNSTISSKMDKTKKMIQPVGTLPKIENDVSLLQNSKSNFKCDIKSRYETKSNNLSKQLPSKIPIFQQSKLPIIHNSNKKFHHGSSLSAADKRQKFHQSRIRISSFNNLDFVGKNENSQMKEDLPLAEVEYTRKCNVALPFFPIYKNYLPPIKSSCSVALDQSTQTKKKKSLQGEFTHFPALCNFFPSKTFHRSKSSTVAQLPPILPPPLPPPPSISSSLEKEAIKENYKYIYPTNISNMCVKPTFLHFFIPV